MGHTNHRSIVGLVVGVSITTLAAACSGAGSARIGPVADDGSVVEVKGRCDLGFNTPKFNETTPLAHHVHDHIDPMAVVEVDFTLDQWAKVFVDEELGSTVDDVVDEVTGNDIYRRHVLGGVLTHSLGPDPWTPMTSRRACDKLASELSQARAVAERFPTVADALAGGYTLGDSYFAGLGVHYQNGSNLGAFDPGNPVQLLYDGTAADSTLVGLSYVVKSPGDVPPDGFTGENDRWHRHRSFCVDLNNGGVNLGSDVLSERECAAVGGAHIQNPDGWMLHAWVVPGCESDWGIFSSANRRLPYMPTGATFASGCNSGKTVADYLALDDRGDGPDVG